MRGEPYKRPRAYFPINQIKGLINGEDSAHQRSANRISRILKESCGEARARYRVDD